MNPSSRDHTTSSSSSSSSDNNIMEEETPSLRSVTIGKAPGALPPMSMRSPSFASKSPLAGPLHAAPPKALVSWTVDAILPTIPADYMLERTNVYIDNSSAQEVADRIVRVLADRSISYKESEETKNSLLGESHSGIRFYVNLFASSEEENVVILEVQRLCGCAFAFRQICREVCRSAKGQSAGAPPPAGAPRLMRQFPMPSSLPRRSEEELKNQCCAEVNRAIRMIQSTMVDSKVLGMDLLEGVSSNPLVAKPLLAEDCLVVLQAFILPEEDEFDIPSAVEVKRACLMKRKALAVVANAMANAEPSELSSASLHSESFVKEVFRSLLAVTEPHTSSQAARCLQSLATSSESTKTFLLGSLNAQSLLSSMEVEHHAMLKTECQKLQHCLSC